MASRPDDEGFSKNMQLSFHPGNVVVLLLAYRQAGLNGVSSGPTKSGSNRTLPTCLSL